MQVNGRRAGEQGRGFAVVAGKVRTLAQRSAEAAKEIKSPISASVERVEQGTALVDQAGQTMGEVVNSIRRVTDIVGEISSASVEQSSEAESSSAVPERHVKTPPIQAQSAAIARAMASICNDERGRFGGHGGHGGHGRKTLSLSGVGQVGEAIGQMDQATQQNAALVEESAAAESPKTQAGALVQAVSVFKVSHGEPAQAAPVNAAPQDRAFTERRRPARARNIARPAFGKKAAAAKPPAPEAAPAAAAPLETGTNDEWVSFCFLSQRSPHQRDSKPGSPGRRHMWLLVPLGRCSWTWARG